MINKLHIRNFQSHKDTELQFSPGMNVIIGDTDSGKTAVIRALKWLIWNRPTGEAFRSWWGGETKIEVDLNGIIVSRSKDKENLYYCDGVKFTAFGADVPFEVRHHLKIDEINLQQQFDQPFLLMNSPGEVARHFNQVANLDKIDTGIKNVQREIRQIEQDTRSTEKDLNERQQELEQYEYLDRMEAEVEVLEEMERQASGQAMRVQRIEALIKEIITLNFDIKDLNSKTEMDEDVTEVLNLIDDKNVLHQNCITLKDLIIEITEMNSLIKASEHIIADEERVDEILSLNKQLHQQVRVNGNLSSILDELEVLERTLNAWRKEAKELEELFHEEMPDTCPLCNQKIKK